VVRNRRYIGGGRASARDLDISALGDRPSGWGYGSDVKARSINDKRLPQFLEDKPKK
jgi:hypothetical protein